MDHLDDQTRHKIRDWQIRRLEIKDLMAAHPERVLELSRVLDQMEEEHERILGEAEVIANTDQGVVAQGALGFELKVSAGSAGTCASCWKWQSMNSTACWKPASQKHEAIRAACRAALGRTSTP